MISLDDPVFGPSACIRWIRLTGQPSGRRVHSIVYSVLLHAGYAAQATAGADVIFVRVSVFMKSLGFYENS